MSRGKFPRDTRNPCSFCAVAIFVNLGTDLHDLFQIWPIVQCLDKKIDSFADTSLVDVCSCVVVSHMMNHCRLNDILCRLFQVLCRLKHIIGLCLQLFCSDRCRQTWIIAGSATFSAGCYMFSAGS